MMKSTTFLVVRHGQTDWNTADRFRGRVDLDLNELGLRQARLVAQRVAAEYHPSAVFSSPLRRSLLTAETIGRALRLEVAIDNGLLDLNYGEFAGLSRPEAAAKFPELYRTWLAAPHMVHFPQGESLEEVRTRVTALVNCLAVRYEGHQVVLVSHVVVIRTLLCSLLGVNAGHIESFRIEPTSITVLEMRGKQVELVMTNSTYHLTGQIPVTVKTEESTGPA